MTIRGKRWIRKAGLAAAAFVIAAIPGITHAQAPPQSGLAISPPTFELSANPGDTLKNSLRVDNIVDKPLEVTVETRNFTALGEEGGVNLSNDEGHYSLANWIRVTPATITIPPRESKVFSYTIAVPANASPGGRFGSIIFKTSPGSISGQSGVAVGQEIGALVFLKIAGHVTEKASIASFAAKSNINEHGPVRFDIRAKNEGNVQFKPTGTITISNTFGQKVAAIPVDAQNVLPGAIRKMAGTWDSSWVFGKYTATLSLVYGSEKQVITASTVFWGFPYKLVGIVLLVMLIVGGLIFPRRRRIGRAFNILFGKD